MRSLTPEEAVRTFDEVQLGYSREEAIAEARRALGFDLTLSTARCPFEVDVPGFVARIADGDFDGAVAIIRESHAWPEVFGRCCHRFCEFPFRPEQRFVPDEAGRGVELTPFISALEWAAGTYGDRGQLPFRAGPPTGRRIAVIGAGSGGVACAWAARRDGHEVDVFEREPVPGGLLFTGYPTFRMSKPAVERENDPAEWGARLHPNHEVGPEEMARIVREYDAVFIGVGRAPITSLDIPSEDLSGVHGALDVLRETWYGRPPRLGPRVMVVGAGFSAMDVSRTARRLGATTVEIVYRRSVDEMLRPGWGQIWVELLGKEGIGFRFQHDPVRIVGDGGRVTAVELVATEPGPPDETGRPIYSRVPGSESVVPTDTVICALGETIDVLPLVGPLGVRLNDRGLIDVDPVTRQTANPRVWAGGDVLGTNGNEAAAMAGIWAAHAMTAWFEGRLDAWREEASTHVKDMRFF